MQDIRPSDSGEERPEPKIAAPSAREALLVFTAGWLGGSGLFTALNPMVEGPVRMLAVLVVSIIRDLLIGAPPGSLIFYAVVVIYLASAEWADRQGGASR